MGYLADRVIDIDVLSGGTLQGSGPIGNVISATVTQELDKAGAIELVVPATDAVAQAVLTNDYEVRIKTADGASYGGIVDTLTKDTQGGQPVYRVTGNDRLGELNCLTTGYNAQYNDAATAAVIIGDDTTAYSLLADTGWSAGTVSVGADFTPWTIQFSGATRLAALIQLAAEIGHHFREGSTARDFDFGLFGADSGYRMVNAFRVTTGAASNVMIVGDVQVASISADIENRLFPLGANSFDLRDAPTTITDILVRCKRRVAARSPG